MSGFESCANQKDDDYHRGRGRKENSGGKGRKDRYATHKGKKEYKDNLGDAYKDYSDSHEDYEDEAGAGSRKRKTQRTVAQPSKRTRKEDKANSHELETRKRKEVKQLESKNAKKKKKSSPVEDAVGCDDKKPGDDDIVPGGSSCHDNQKTI